MRRSNLLSSAGESGTDRVVINFVNGNVLHYGAIIRTGAPRRSGFVP